MQIIKVIGLLGLAVIVFLLFKLADKEERLVKKFVQYAQNLEIEELKAVCATDTKLLLEVYLDPMLKLGNEGTTTALGKMMSTLNCRKKKEHRQCNCVDEKGRERTFDIQLVMDYDYYGAKRLMVEIDKSSLSNWY